MADQFTYRSGVRACANQVRCECVAKRVNASMLQARLFQRGGKRPAKVCGILWRSAFGAELRQMKDANNNYIWNDALGFEQPNTILGCPVYTSEYMPQMMEQVRVTLDRKLRFFFKDDTEIEE